MRVDAALRSAAPEQVGALQGKAQAYEEFLTLLTQPAMNIDKPTN